MPPRKFLIGESAGKVCKKTGTAAAKACNKAERYAKLQALKSSRKKKPGAKGNVSHKVGVAADNTVVEKQKAVREKRRVAERKKTTWDQIEHLANVAKKGARVLAFDARRAGKVDAARKLAGFAGVAGTVEAVADFAGDAVRDTRARKDAVERGEPVFEKTWSEWALGQPSEKQQLQDQYNENRAVGAGAAGTTAKMKAVTGARKSRHKLSVKNEKKAEAQAKRHAALRAVDAVDPDHVDAVRGMKRQARTRRRTVRKKTELVTEHDLFDPLSGAKIPKGQAYDLNTAWGKKVFELEKRAVKEEGQMGYNRVVDALEANNQRMYELWLAQMSRDSGNGRAPPPEPQPRDPTGAGPPTMAPSLAPAVMPTVLPTVGPAIVGAAAGALTDNRANEYLDMFEYTGGATKLLTAAAGAAAIAGNAILGGPTRVNDGGDGPGA